MSYILDALKKSDRDRLRHATPALATVHSEFHARRGWRIAQPSGVLLVLLLGAGVAGGLWYLYGGGAPSLEEAALVEPVPQPPAPVQGTGAAAGEQAKAGSEVSTASALPNPAGSAGADVEDSFPPAVELPELVEIWELTEAEQRYLQELEVTLHVHSPDPAQRTVIINGLRAREGQSLGQDLLLEEITPDGLIFRFQGRRVHLATVGR